MTSPLPRQTVLVVLTSEEADALVQMGAALEPVVQRGCPFDTATAKMDEQAARQLGGFRQMVGEAEDELTDQLGVLTEHEFDRLDRDKIAEAIVRRVLGVYGDV
jgi:hypothetical protein